MNWVLIDLIRFAADCGVVLMAKLRRLSGGPQVSESREPVLLDRAQGEAGNEVALHQEEHGHGRNRRHDRAR